MISLNTIKQHYPPYLQNDSNHILREYLQYEILQYIFQHKFANKLCFIGGTALRLIYENQRFSEDLDFDNFGLSKVEFEEMMTNIKSYLQKNGYEVEIKTIYKGVFHCHIKLPGILYNYKLSPMKSAKIIIKIDTIGQGYKFKPIVHNLNKFQFTFPIFVASKNLLLSYKLTAIFHRRRAKGRDFFDIMFLLGMTKKPDWGFLKQKLQVDNSDQLKDKIINFCQDLNFDRLQKDVSPFLFNPNDKKVELFLNYIKSIEFEE